MTQEEKITKIKAYVTMYDKAGVVLVNPSFDLMLEDAMNSLSEKYFGSFYCKAVALCIMHNFCLAQRAAAEQSGGGSGIVVQKTIGPVSVKFAELKSSESSYNATSYGRMLLDLIRTCGGGAISVTGAWRLL